MDVKNLAIVFGIFGSEDELPKGGDLLTVHALNVGYAISASFSALLTFLQGHPDG